jgi:chromosome partitioning protein
MRTIAVVSQKGGAGKTTLALHIAVAAELAGYGTVLVDMDPQGTAEAWSEWRKEAPPTVIPAKTATLMRTLERAAAHGAEFAIIDTPPLAEAEARAAAKAADLVLVPCRPNAFDLHSIRTTTDLTRFAAKPAFAVFNAGPASAAKLYAETTELVTEIGMQVAPMHVTDRAAFRHATGSGQAAQEIEPEGKGAAEIAALWQWVCQQVGVPLRQNEDVQTGVSDDATTRQRKSTAPRSRGDATGRQRANTLARVVS